jgi:ADP-dependent NAD(P)H-hydrate dehydratase
MPTPTDHATQLVTASALREWPLPDARGSKHDRGHVLVVGGSPSTPGAVMLAGLSALRVGAGVLALAVARSVAGSVAVALPEAAVHGLGQLDGTASDPLDYLASADAVLVGPGLDDADVTRDLLGLVLDTAADGAGLVLDAFALGVLPGVEGFDRRAGRAVLTPNTSEAERLLDVAADELDGRDQVEVAADIARRYGAVVSYWGHVAAPDGRRWSVPAGHAGLGTSGSGDVLAGAVVGLLARGADPAQAGCWATYLHATAGDRLAPRVGRLGFLARELVDELPLVLVQTEV